jgi:nucleotide-binding universal stress UspA family protein
MKVLLPLDGSSCSEAAIPMAKEFAALDGGSLVIMTVGNLPESTTMAREEEEQLAEMLRRVNDQFGLAAEMKVDMAGDPVQGILSVADDANADLIVMATHGRSGLSELAQGSVATGVVRDGRKPVLLVRPKEGTD